MPISQFVAANGWPKFREIEHRISDCPDFASKRTGGDRCGGGVIENPEKYALPRQTLADRLGGL